MGRNLEYRRWLGSFLRVCPILRASDGWEITVDVRVFSSFHSLK